MFALGKVFPPPTAGPCARICPCQTWPGPRPCCQACAGSAHEAPSLSNHPTGHFLLDFSPLEAGVGLEWVEMSHESTFQMPAPTFN